MVLRSKSSRRRRRLPSALAEAVESRCLLTAVVVNSLPDVVHSGGSVISLRDAIAIANTSATPTTITFSPNVFAAATTLTLTQGFLDLTNTSAATTISGPVAPLTISFNNNAVLAQAGGFVQEFETTLTLSNLTITKSFETGIFTDGNLTLNNVVVTGNASDSAAAAGIAFEGDAVINATNLVVSNNNDFNAGTAGIYGNGKLTLTDATVSNNNTADDQAGSVHITDGGVASLRNVTVYGNSEGGIEFDNPAAASLYNVTVANNGGFGVYSGGPAPVTIANTIVAGNTQPDVQGSFTSKGHNLIGDVAGAGFTSTGWIATDLQGTDAKPVAAKLGALANNGGFSQTLLPQTGSPAIDAGSNALVPSGITTDQRGLPRVQGTAVDIGAVEVQPPPVITVTAPAAQTATLGTSATVTLGSFTQTNATAPFKLDIAWGDGTADTLLSLTAAGTIPATAHTFAKSGAITVSETVTDAGTGKSNTAKFIDTVASGAAIKYNPPASQSTTLGASTTVALGAFTQSGATGPFKVDVNWGDGTADTVLTLTAAGTIPATPHTFAKTGAITVTETVTDAAGRKSPAVTFVETVVDPKTASIAGRVFNDANADRKIDNGEAGLGLYTVYIDANNNGTLDGGEKSVTTDINGNFTFTGLAAGTYTVRVVPVLGIVSTLATSNVLTITLTVGQASTGNLFGEKSST